MKGQSSTASAVVRGRAKADHFHHASCSERSAEYLSKLVIMDQTHSKPLYASTDRLYKTKIRGKKAVSVYKKYISCMDLVLP